MFFEVVKDIRNGRMKSYKIVSLAEMLEKHPYCMDLRSWSGVGRLNTKFGLSNKESQFIYVKTDKTDKIELEKLAYNL